MIELLKKYKKWIIVFSFVYFYMFFMFVAQSGYSAITPGEVSKTNNIYDIEGKSFNNNINTVSVYSWQKITIFQKWLIENNPNYYVFLENNYEKTLTFSEIYQQGQISHQSSINNALIAAYEMANKKDKTINIDYDLEGLTVYATGEKNLKIGDLVTKIEGDELLSKDDFNVVLSKYKKILPDATKNHVSVFRAENDLKLKIIRSGTSQDITIKDGYAFQFFPKYKIKSTTPNLLNIKMREDVGGPSGGMIQAFTIYAALLNFNSKNIKIAGTGTIETDDTYSVGRIGGIRQKFITVVNEKVDVFVIPESHYDEIKDLINKNSHIKIITVKNFKELTEKMEQFGQFEENNNG